jgi:hypothetical protein
MTTGHRDYGTPLQIEPSILFCFFCFAWWGQPGKSILLITCELLLLTSHRDARSTLCLQSRLLLLLLHSFLHFISLVHSRIHTFRFIIYAQSQPALFPSESALLTCPFFPPLAAASMLVHAGLQRPLCFFSETRPQIRSLLSTAPSR